MSTTRFGVVTLVGATNVGKSSLVNSLLGEKLSIVSPRVQTTVRQFRALLSDESSQILFLDCPGFLPKTEEHHPLLDHRIDAEIDRSLKDVNLVVWLVTANRLAEKGWDPVYQAHYHHLKKGGRPLFLVINKIDRVPKESIPTLLSAIPTEVTEPKFLLSARTGEGIPELKKAILSLLPEGPFLFDSDISTPHTLRELCVDKIRESCFYIYGEEVPYRVYPAIERFTTTPDLVTIEATLYYDSANLKPLLIGKGGANLKKLGTHVRHLMEEYCGAKVFFRLQVKLKEGWQDNPGFLTTLGFPHPASDNRHPKKNHQKS